MVDPGGDFRVVDPRGDFKAIHEVGTEEEMVEPKRVFASSSSRSIMIDRLRGTVGRGLQSTIGDQCTIQYTNRTSPSVLYSPKCGLIKRSESGYSSDADPEQLTD